MTSDRTGSVSLVALGVGLATALAVVGYFKSEEGKLLSQIPIPSLGKDVASRNDPFGQSNLAAAVIGDQGGVPINLDDAPISLDASRLLEHNIVRIAFTSSAIEDCISILDAGWIYIYDRDLGESARVAQAERGEIQASEIFPIENFYLFGPERTGAFSHFHHEQTLTPGEERLVYVQSLLAPAVFDCSQPAASSTASVAASEGTESSQTAQQSSNASVVASEGSAASEESENSSSLASSVTSVTSVTSVASVTSVTSVASVTSATSVSSVNSPVSSEDIQSSQGQQSSLASSDSVASLASSEDQASSEIVQSSSETVQTSSEVGQSSSMVVAQASSETIQSSSIIVSQASSQVQQSSSTIVVQASSEGALSSEGQNPVDEDITVEVNHLSISESNSVSGIVVENQKDVLLYRFEVTPTGGDIFFHEVLLGTYGGDARNMQNYRIKVDADESAPGTDLILQSGVSENQQLILFDEFIGGGFAIPDGETRLFEVFADAASSLVSPELAFGNQLLIGFQYGAGDFLGIERLEDGSDILGIEVGTDGCPVSECNIKINQGRDFTWTIVKQGNLIVRELTAPMRSRYLLAGTTTEDIFGLELSALYEDVSVTALRFFVDDGVAESVDHLQLVDQNGQVIGLPSRALCFGAEPEGVTAFCTSIHSEQLVVEEDKMRTVFVQPVLKNDNRGAIRGEIIKLSMPAQVAEGAFHNDPSALSAVGMESSNKLSINDGDQILEGEILIGNDDGSPNQTIQGVSHKVIFSHVANITNENSDADFSNVPSGKADVGVFQFHVAGNNNVRDGTDRVTLESITFSIRAKNITLDPTQYKLFNENDTQSDRSAPCESPDGYGEVGEEEIEFQIICDHLTDHSSLDTEISSVGDETFFLEVDVQNPRVNGSVESLLQVSLRKFDIGREESERSIRWLDKDSGGEQELAGFDLFIEDVSSTLYGTAPGGTSSSQSAGPLCGDGVVVAPETCDDGNTASGDGCDESCSTELLFLCQGEPSICTIPVPTIIRRPVAPGECGNGSIESGETCDDGNTSDDDGCSDTCSIEPLYICTGQPSQCSIPVPEIP